MWASSPPRQLLFTTLAVSPFLFTLFCLFIHFVLLIHLHYRNMVFCTKNICLFDVLVLNNKYFMRAPGFDRLREVSLVSFFFQSKHERQAAERGVHPGVWPGTSPFSSLQSLFIFTVNLSICYFRLRVGSSRISEHYFPYQPFKPHHQNAFSPTVLHILFAGHL